MAWAKASGLSRIGPAIEAFRASGGRAEIILGVDANGGTWEGLQRASELFDRAWLFHDPGSRTFHPKVYLVQDPNMATAYVGSGNLTRGGLYTNYEAEIVVGLDRSSGADEELLAKINAYFDWFIAQDQSRELNADLIAELRVQAPGLIQSEREQNSRSASRRTRQAESFFGSAIGGLATAPVAPPTALSTDAEDEDASLPPWTTTVSTEIPEDGDPTTDSAPVASSSLSSGFYKRLANNDVSTSSAPGQMIIPIKFLDFFPSLIVEKDGTALGGPRQSARIIPLTFKDAGWERQCEARVILYEPALNHPRRNSEVRFTFRDREILARLSAGDYLVFENTGTVIVVSRQSPGSFPKPWNWL